jgi:hypothetical protein
LGHTFDRRFLNIAAINDLDEEDLNIFRENDTINLNLGAVRYSDGVISGNASANDMVRRYAEENNKPFQESPEDIQMQARSSVDFYKMMLEE